MLKYKTKTYLNFPVFKYIKNNKIFFIMFDKKIYYLKKTNLYLILFTLKHLQKNNILYVTII